MDITFLVLMALLALAIWFFVRIRQSGTGRRSVDSAARDAATRYHAVSIKTTSKSCAAAKDLLGRRFLSPEAPRLPLPDCDAPECKCRFVHHKDRRGDKDRRSPFSPAGFGGGTGNYEKEKRARNDRRDNEDD